MWVTYSKCLKILWIPNKIYLLVKFALQAIILRFGNSVQFSSIQLLSHVWLSATPWIAACQASLSITNSQSSLRLTSIESVIPSNHLILCRPLLLLPPIPPSISVFSNESTLLMRWPKYWSFSFSIVPSKEILGLIFIMDWLDLLAVQGTLKSLLQHHSSKASVLRGSALCIHIVRSPEALLAFGSFFRLILLLNDLILMSTGQVFCKISLSWNLSLTFFSGLDSGSGFWERRS